MKLLELSLINEVYEWTMQGDHLNKMMQLVICSTEEVPLRYSRDTMVHQMEIV